MKTQKLKSFTRDEYVSYYGSKKTVNVPTLYREVETEVRGVWFSTVDNIDFKAEDFATPESGKKFLKEVIDKCYEYKLNTVIFQVRPTNDALYESDINPWSKFLNKERKEGINPGFDPLKYFIAEAKKKKIEVHAWINPYRVSHEQLDKINMTKDQYLNTLDDKNFAKNHRDLVLETSLHKLILDPASLKVQDYLVETILEIAKKYDVKAIHIDDYFYPYEKFVDDAEKQKRDVLQPTLKIDDFRRYNVNEMIRKLHIALGTIQNNVQLGISPFSIYRTNSKWFQKEGKEGGWRKGSDNMCGVLEGYETLYCDVYKWMKEGWINYCVPQIYFEFDYYMEKDGKMIDKVKYADMVKWWAEVARETHTSLYIGQALYKYSDKGAWSNSEEIINQLKFNQTYSAVTGNIFFTYKNLVADKPASLVEARRLLKELWKKQTKTK